MSLALERPRPECEHGGRYSGGSVAVVRVRFSKAFCALALGHGGASLNEPVCLLQMREACTVSDTELSKVATALPQPRMGALLRSRGQAYWGFPRGGKEWLGTSAGSSSQPKGPPETNKSTLPSLFRRDKYQVFDSAPRGLLRVEELEDQGQTLANVFILRLLENADDREATYMLKASSQ